MKFLLVSQIDTDSLARACLRIHDTSSRADFQEYRWLFSRSFSPPIFPSPIRPHQRSPILFSSLLIFLPLLSSCSRTHFDFPVDSEKHEGRRARAVQSYSESRVEALSIRVSLGSSPLLSRSLFLSSPSGAVDEKFIFIYRPLLHPAPARI